MLYTVLFTFTTPTLLLMAATTTALPLSYYIQTYSLDLGIIIIYDYSLIVAMFLDFRERIPSRVPLEPADRAIHLS